MAAFDVPFGSLIFDTAGERETKEVASSEGITDDLRSASAATSDMEGSPSLSLNIAGIMEDLDLMPKHLHLQQQQQQQHHQQQEKFLEAPPLLPMPPPEFAKPAGPKGAEQGHCGGSAAASSNGTAGAWSSSTPLTSSSSSAANSSSELSASKHFFNIDNAPEGASAPLLPAALAEERDLGVPASGLCMAQHMQRPMQHSNSACHGSMPAGVDVPPAGDDDNFHDFAASLDLLQDDGMGTLLPPARGIGIEGLQDLQGDYTQDMQDMGYPVMPALTSIRSLQGRRRDLRQKGCLSHVSQCEMTEETDELRRRMVAAQQVQMHAARSQMASLVASHRQQVLQQDTSFSSSDASDANRVDPELYKVKLCRNIMTTGGCQYASQCVFAHAPCELRSRETNLDVLKRLYDACKPTVNPLKYKVIPCKKYLEAGACPYNAHCVYAHGEAELRTVQHNLQAMSRIQQMCQATGLVYAPRHSQQSAPYWEPARQ